MGLIYNVYWLEKTNSVLSRTNDLHHEFELQKPKYGVSLLCQLQFNWFD
jgi:hypothetical protein